MKAAIGNWRPQDGAVWACGRRGRGRWHAAGTGGGVHEDRRRDRDRGGAEPGRGDGARAGGRHLQRSRLPDRSRRRRVRRSGGGVPARAGSRRRGARARRAGAGGGRRGARAGGGAGVGRSARLPGRRDRRRRPLSRRRRRGGRRGGGGSERRERWLQRRGRRRAAFAGRDPGDRARPCKAAARGAAGGAGDRVRLRRRRRGRLGRRARRRARGRGGGAVPRRARRRSARRARRRARARRRRPEQRRRPRRRRSSRCRATGSTACARLRRAGDGACGDRLVASERAADGELLGYVAAQPAGGTAALTELVAPDGCGAIYETDADAIALWVADGWAPGAVVGYVWPPGWGDAPAADDGAVATDAVKSCALGRNPALFLFYTGIDRASDSACSAAAPARSSSARSTWIGRTAARRGERARRRRPHRAHLRRQRQAVPRAVAAAQRRRAHRRVHPPAPEGRLRLCRRRRGHHRSELGRRRDGQPPLPPAPVAHSAAHAHPVHLDRPDDVSGRRAGAARAPLAPPRVQAARARAGARGVPAHRRGHGRRGASDLPRRRRSHRRRGARHARRRRHQRARDHDARPVDAHALPAVQLPRRRAPRSSAIARQATAVRHASSRTRAQHGLGFYFIGRSDITPSRRYRVADVVAGIHQAMLRFR